MSFEDNIFTGIDYNADIDVAATASQADYSQSINPQTILKNPQFLQDLRDYYEEKEGRHIHWSNEQLVDNFYADSTWRELNTVSAIGGAFEPWGMGEESRLRAKRIESVWKQLPMFWQEGGRGAGTALPDILGAIVADPLNLIPVGAAAKTAKAAYIAGKGIKSAVARGAGKAALAEGGIAGAQEGVVNASTQARDIQLGLRDDFSKGELALATGLGATIGGVVGGGLGIPGALAGVAAGRNTVDSLLAKGLTRQQIAELGPEALAKSGDVNMYGQPPVQQADEAIAETAEEATQEPTIDQLIAIQRQVIDTLSKDGAETEEASTILGLLEQAKEFDEVISPKAEDYIRKLEAHGTERARKIAAKERIALNNLRTIVENIKKGDAQDFDGDLTKLLAYLNDNSLSKKVRNIPLEGTPKTGEVVDEVVDAAEEVADAQKVVDAEAPPPEDNVVTTALAEDDTRRVELNKVMDDEVIDILDEAGIDPFIVAPAPKQKRVSMAQARRIIKRKKDLEGQPSDSPALIAQEQLEKSIRVLEATTGKEVTPTERSMLARVIESDAGLKRNALYIEETDLKKLGQDVVPEKEWIGNEQLTPDEIKQYKIIKRRFAKKAADAPEGSDLKLPKVTEARARVAFLEQRKRQPGKARTTGEPIDDAGIYTTAGREDSGKIQGILKKGEFTGEGGGSPGSAKISKWTGEPLGRRKFKKYGDRETAYVESKKYPKSSPNRLVGFYNARSMRVIDENGKEVKVTPGTLVYADGHTKKVFLNKEAAFKRTGLKAPDNVKQEELIHKANKKMPTAEEIASREASAKFAEDALGQPLPEKLSDAEILQEAIDNGDGEALLKALRAIENGEELSPNQNTVKDVDIEVAPVTKGDKRLIVQNKNNPDDVRIISKKQVAEGKGIESIIGQKGGANSDISNWNVKYAPADTKAYGRKLRELFDRLPSEEGQPTAGGRFESGGSTGLGEPIDLKEARKLTIELNKKDIQLVRRFSVLAQKLMTEEMTESVKLEIPETIFDGETVNINWDSINGVMRYLSMSAKWANNKTTHLEIIDVFKGFIELENRVLPPEGVIDSTANRQATINNLDKIFAGYDADEIAAARRLLERLGGDPTLGPRITTLTKKEGALSNNAYYAPDGSQPSLRENIELRDLGSSIRAMEDELERPAINLSPAIKDISIPMNVKLLHEVGHWAFDNILTSRDKLQFLEAMSKYYVTKDHPHMSKLEGNVDWTKVDEGSFSSPIKEEVLDERYAPGGRKSLVFENALESPGEFFANQFAAWAARNDEKLVIKDESFWKKMAGYLKGTFDRFFYKTPIDPDLEPLFLKILPNRDEIGKRSMGVVDAKTPGGKAVEAKHKQVSDVFKRMQQFTEDFTESDTANPEGFVRQFTEDLWLLANIVYNKKKSGEFVSISRYAKTLIRERLKDINEIFQGSSKSGEGIDWVKLATEIGNSNEAGNVGVSIVDAGKMEEVAEKLIDLFHHGYTGESFKGPAKYEVLGEAGEVIGYNYGKIKDLDRTSMVRMFDFTLESLERNWAKYEDTNKIMRNSHTEQDTAIVSKKKAERGSGKKSNSTKRISNKEEHDYKKSVDNAKTEFKNKKKPNAKKVNSKVNAGDASELKTKSLSQLQKMMNEHEGTEYGRQIAEHIVRKLKTSTMPEKAFSKEIPREFVEMTKPELERLINDETAKGNTKARDFAIRELQRRIDKRASKKAGQDTSKHIGMIGRSKNISNKIDIEIKDSEGIQVSDGIPANARPMVKDILSYVTHRDPEREVAARTIIYRLLNIMGKVSRKDGVSNPILSKDISRLVGSNYLAKGSDEFSDYKGGDFSVLRSTARILGQELNSTPGDETVRYLSSMSLRASMTREELDVVTFAFNQLSPIKMQKIIDTYKKGSGSVLIREGAPDELLHEYMMIDWMAGNFQKVHSSKDDLHLMSLTDEMLTGVASKLDQRYTEGDVFGTVSNLYKRNMEEVAYIMNGLVKSEDFKESYFGLTRLYGDMFINKRRGGLIFPIETNDVFHSSYAADAGKSAWKTATQKDKVKIINFTKGGVGLDSESGKPIVFYHGTPNKKALDGSDVGTVMNLSSSNSLFGRGIYLTKNPVVAEESYARKQTKESLNIQIDKLPVTDEAKDELQDVAHELANLRGKISLLKRQNGKLIGADAEGEASEIQAFIEKVLVEDQLRGLIAQEKGKVAFLQKSGVTIEPYVMPSYIQLRNPLDFRENKRYSVDDPIFATIAEEAYIKLKGAGVDDSEILEELVNMETTLGGREFITGVELYEHFGNFMNKFSNTKSEAKDALTDIFESLGHDGMIVSHTNTVTDASDIKIGNPVYHEGAVVFKPNQVKHVKSVNFDGGSDQVFNIELGGGIPEGTNGSIIMASIDDPSLKINELPTGKFGELLEVDGESRTFTGVASSMIKKRPHNDSEVEVIRNSSAPTWFQSQSDRLNKLGARWLGNWYKNHFTEISSKFASKFMPINNLMRDLPDSDGSLRRWFRKSTGSVLQKQPESYGKIVRALRRDVDSRQYKALNAQEKAVVDKIRQTFDEERRMLKNSGFHVGFRKNYLPQVWNQNVIRKNKDEFIQGMQEYYVREQASLGKMPPEGESKKFAEQIYLRLTEDAAEDGVFLPHKDIRGLSKNPSNDSIDFSRVLNIGDFPESLNAMEKFLENDLDAILVKYLEGSTRRLVHADKMGVNTHAVSDYILASNEGASGIAKLLSTSKVFKKNIRGMSEDGNVVESVLTDTIRMPFEGNEFNAKKFADRLVAVHAQSGSSAARKMIYDLMPKMSVTYKRRADAIIGALDDFKGQTGSIAYEGEKFIDNAMRVAMKKPLTDNKSLMEASKLVRTVNNVTLLGFTTLTSMGDIVLPIIRSGSFGSWASGLQKWMFDPEYRRMLSNVGVAMENIVHERMVHMYGAPDNKLSHAFFSATLLTPWTDLQRKIAGATGLESFKSMQQQATRHFKPGVPYAQQAAKYKTAHRYLQRYGLEEYLPKQNKADMSLSDSDVLNNDKVRMAIIKFADESIFQPNPNDVPLWAQTPIGQLVFQLKSFPLMMARMGGYVMQEANQGNFKPLMSFAVLGPTFGMATLTAKDIIQHRGGEDGRSPEPRKRNVAKALGWDSKTHGEDYNDFLGWYIEGMMIMGGLGLMGDVLHSVTSQVDNGAYGQNRIWSTLLGPSYGLGNAAITGAAGMQDAIMGGDNSNAKERSAWREIATRIPILGGMRNIRENIVDTVAGEQGGGSSKKSGGWGDSGWASGKDAGWGSS